MASPEREEIAEQHGFASFAELLDISDKIPMMPGNTVQSYLARHPNGHWFVWDDVPTRQPVGDTECGGSTR